MQKNVHFLRMTAAPRAPHNLPIKTSRHGDLILRVSKTRIMAMEETCIACACELKKGTAQRRKLYSPSTCHLLPVLQGLCKEHYSCEDVDRLLPSVAESGRSDKEEIYLCMKCFRQLEKLTRLRKESALVEESLKDGLQKVAQLRQLPAKATPSRKRPAVSASP